MPKIICLIKNKPPLTYFVNKIHEKHEIALVILETGSGIGKTTQKPLLSKIREKGIFGCLVALKNIISSYIYFPQRTPNCEKYFGNKWKELNPAIPTLKVQNINSDLVKERLKEEKPDLLLDHGTSLIKNHIIKAAPLTINLHWGLSPYYRGTHCTQWALLKKDPANIGVTIHKLAKEIDGGDILAQERAKITPEDTVDSINMQLTCLGTDLIIKAINKLKSGKKLEFKKQDYSQGRLTLNKHWNKKLEKQLKTLKIESILKKPPKKLPIVRLP